MVDEKMTLEEFHKKIAIQSNNGIWPTLDKKNPTYEELEDAMHMAHTARYHWSKVGTVVNAVRAEYMLARIYAHMRRSEPALFHANRGLELAKEAETKDEWKDWDMPFIYEALARAHALTGNKSECKKYKDLAQKATDEVEDEEDRKICQGELDKFLY
ncbi:MAG: hypothetical protein E4H14_03330 [Candidatus Thorarchaeota archaeon]|nr:MAG: hypothetical protein E4H14_03330 [Candidatus Thorarchaeota archaeon]